MALAIPARAEFHDVAAQLPVEFLYAVIIRIDHVHVALPIAGNAGRIVEIGIRGSEVAPQDDEVAGVVEFLNAIVPVVDDKEAPLLIDARP